MLDYCDSISKKMDLSQEELIVILSYIKPNKYLIVALVCKYFKDILFKLYGAGYQLKVNLNYLTSNMDLLTYAFNIHIPNKFKNKLCSSASSHGNIDGLIFLYERGYLLDKESAVQAAKYGKLECLKFISKIDIKLLTKYACKRAATYGHLDCLKFIYENRGNYVFDKNVSMTAAGNGHLECLMYLHKFGCPWNVFCASEAAKNGHIDCLKYAIFSNCPHNAYICELAAKNGHLECFKFSLRVNYRYLTVRAFYSALSNGHLEIIKFIFNSKIKGRAYTHNDINPCNIAAQNGHLEILEYLHLNKCAWNETTCFLATRFGHLNCLRYCYENDCPINIENCKSVLMETSPENEIPNLTTNNAPTFIYLSLIEYLNSL